MWKPTELMYDSIHRKNNATNRKPQKTRDNAAAGSAPAAALSRILYGCGAVGI